MINPGVDHGAVIVQIQPGTAAANAGYGRATSSLQPTVTPCAAWRTSAPR